MKKIFLIILGVIGFLSSCSKDNEITNDPIIPKSTPEVDKSLMITKWKTVEKNGKNYIAIKTRGGANYVCKNEKDNTIVKEGILPDDKKIEIELEPGNYLVELTPLKEDSSMSLFMGTVSIEEAQCLLEISQWGNFSRGKSTSNMLTNCTEVKILAEDIPNFSSVTDMNNMFNKCTSIETIPNINKWDVSKVTDMMNMFIGAYKFNSDISGWNTSNVTNMTRMFAQTTLKYANGNIESTKGKFNQDLSKWNVSKVTKMDAMFRSCVDFNQELNNWNVSKVTAMEGMFEAASKFNKSIKNWNVAEVSNMSSMFSGASSFNQALNWDTNKVKKFKNMFKDASAFNQSLASFTINKSYSNLDGMLDNSGLSCVNYDATLKAWAENENTKKVMKFSAIGLKYTDKLSHDKLISEKKWSIRDGDIYDADCN